MSKLGRNTVIPSHSAATTANVTLSKQETPKGLLGNSLSIGWMALPQPIEPVDRISTGYDAMRAIQLC